MKIELWTGKNRKSKKSVIEEVVSLDSFDECFEYKYEIVTESGVVIHLSEGLLKRIFLDTSNHFESKYEYISKRRNKMKIITKQEIDSFMEHLEKDYTDNLKPMLVPRNNREYWLFTEIWQRCTDFFNNLQTMKKE